LQRYGIISGGVLMSKAHNRSLLSIREQITLADENTCGIWHFDNHLYSTRGTKPTGKSVVTIRQDGLFGCGVAIEESTTNLIEPNTSFVAGDVSVSEYNPGNNKLYIVRKTGTNALPLWACIRKEVAIEPGEQYTLSFKAKMMSPGNIEQRIGYHWGGKSLPGVDFISLNNGWYLCIKTGLTSEYDITTCGVGFIGDNSPFGVIITDIQLEKKNFATSYVHDTRDEPNLAYPADIINQESGTISFWLRPHTLAQPSTNDPILIRISDESHQLCINASSIYINDLIINNEFETYVWYYIVYTWDNSSDVKQRLYLYNDSILYTAESSKPTSQVDSLGNIWIGCGGAGIRPANSTFDELRIDKIARTHKEIERWYIARAPFHDPIDTTSISI
jgi:hypothetical protein